MMIKVCFLRLTEAVGQEKSMPDLKRLVKSKTWRNEYLWCTGRRKPNNRNTTVLVKMIQEDYSVMEENSSGLCHYRT